MSKTKSWKFFFPPNLSKFVYCFFFSISHIIFVRCIVGFNHLLKQVWMQRGWRRIAEAQSRSRAIAWNTMSTHALLNAKSGSIGFIADAHCKKINIINTITFQRSEWNLPHEKKFSSSYLEPLPLTRDKRAK